MHVLNVQSGSSQPPMLSMYNQAAPTSHALNVQSGTSQPHVLRQFPTSHALNVQSSMQSSCSQRTLSPMWNTYMSFKYPPLSCTPGCASIYDCPRQVSATPLWNWELLQVAKHLRKTEICKMPMHKNEYLIPSPRILLLFSSSFLVVTQSNPM